MPSELESIKQFFESHQIILSRLWLERCTIWCKEEKLFPNYTTRELQLSIFEQWLLSDLREAEISCLPPNLSTHVNYKLIGSYSVQVLQVVDISKPKYLQLSKIRNTDRNLEEEKESNKRVLQLTLTDGVQEVEAVEYRRVSCFNLNLAPGVKIRLNGPITVRRGRLMLEERNVKYLGGFVEEITVSNAAENVLARALHLPENENPNTVVEINNENVDTTNRNTNNPVVNRVVNPPIVQNIPAINTAIQTNGTRQPAKRRAAEEENESNSRMDFQDLVAADMFDDDDFNDMDFDNIVEESSTPDTVISIRELIALKNNLYKGIKKVRAKFKAIVEKLTFTPERYRLLIGIEDDTGEITVSVHSDIIAVYTECSSSELSALKELYLEHSGEAKRKILKAMQYLKIRVMKLDDLVEIELNGADLPVIVKTL